ncbi:hypothetical protein GCM10027048_41070 [Hymenobacter coalescens]
MTHIPAPFLRQAARRSSLLLLAVALASPLRAQTGGKEQLSVALSAPAKPGTLHVKLVSGSINVVGYGGKEVLIAAETGPRSSPHRGPGPSDIGPRPGRGPTPPTGPGMRRIDSNASFDLTAEEKDNHVYVRSQSWQRPVNLTIKVPQRFSLQISTVQDGDITVENVSGELEVNNVNGAIELNQVSGSAVATTVNGPVTASFKTVTAGAPMAFSTVNGKVDVGLPASTKASLKLKSDHGEIYSDFDLTTERNALKASRPTGTNGMYRLSVDEWNYGKLNGGGAEIMLKSLQGNIYIRKNK